VLKIYAQEDFKSYKKEVAVFMKLKNLKNCIGYPEMISKIESKETAELLMEALGPNLRKLLAQCPGKLFSKTTVYMLTIQLVSNTPFLIFVSQLKRLRILHELGFVHNDLKLDNILVGHKDPSLIYLIDFGLACKYLEADGSHSKKKYIEKFSGNFLFASLNSCRGNNKSRRDDI
jgi:serine/threonine protein kinase